MRKILIVEDDEDIAQVLKKRLLANNYQVVVAGDGIQGVRRARNDRPDLILLDLMLPGGNGLIVLKNIRKHVTSEYLPVVVLTGVGDSEFKKRILEEGVDAYIEKPYDPEELLGTIEGILRAKRVSHDQHQAETTRSWIR